MDDRGPAQRVVIIDLHLACRRPSAEAKEAELAAVREVFDPYGFLGLGQRRFVDICGVC